MLSLSTCAAVLCSILAPAAGDAPTLTDTSGSAKAASVQSVEVDDASMTPDSGEAEDNAIDDAGSENVVDEETLDESRAIPAGQAGDADGGMLGAPLPVPPPDIPAEFIAKGPWRGHLRLDFSLAFGGPLVADNDAAGDIFGAGAEFSLSARPTPWLGVGFGIGTMPHASLSMTEEYYFAEARAANYFDVLIVRGYLPTNSRVQPYIDIGGGFVHLEAVHRYDEELGGQFRGGLGLDFWVARSLSLGWNLRYRSNFVDGDWGHLFQSTVGISMHF